MSTTTRTRRRQFRYELGNEKAAMIEFEQAGRQFRLPLTNLSASGVSFIVDELVGSPRMEEGIDIHGATIRVGDCLIQGDLVVMHLTPQSSTSQVCGALLYPTSDSDLIKLKSVLAGMQAVAD